MAVYCRRGQKIKQSSENKKTRGTRIFRNKFGEGPEYFEKAYEMFWGKIF